MLVAERFANSAMDADGESLMPQAAPPIIHASQITHTSATAGVSARAPKIGAA